MYDSFLTAYKAFKRAQVEDPLFETLHLMDILFNGAVRRMDFRSLDNGEVSLSRIVEERQQGRPLEYTLGRATFMGLTLYSSPAAPIPRQETELLAHTVLDSVDQRISGTAPVLVIDACTGSGNIAVSLAVYSQHTYVLATDQSQDALALAAQNVHRFGLQKRISLFSGCRLSPLAGKGYENRVDVVIGSSNVPAEDDGAASADSLSSHGSPCVHGDAEKSLQQVRLLAHEALDFLKSGGLLALEIAGEQEMAVCNLLHTIAGYKLTGTTSDLSGNVSVISAIRA